MSIRSAEKRIAVMAIFAVVMIIAFVFVRQTLAQDPEPTPAPVLVRAVFLEGEASVAAWPVTAQATGSQVAVSPASGMPNGITLQVVGNVARFISDGTSEPGAHSVVLQVKISTPPPLSDWTGGMVESTHNVSVEFHVLPELTNPFLNGPVDILATQGP